MHYGVKYYVTVIAISHDLVKLFCLFCFFYHCINKTDNHLQPLKRLTSPLHVATGHYDDISVLEPHIRQRAFNRQIRQKRRTA